MKTWPWLGCSILLALPANAEVSQPVPPMPPVVADVVTLQPNDAAVPSQAPDVITEQASPFLQALVSAYTTNPKLKAEREQLKAVDEGVAEALSGFRPHAQANIARGRQRSKTTGAWNYQDSSSRSASISQPLFSGGQTVYGYQSAKQNVKAARADLRMIEQQVLLAAVSAYSDVFEKQSVLELTQNNVDVLGKQLQATKDRFEVGDLTRTDIAQAEARYAAAVAASQQAHGDLKTAKATFQKVVGYAPDNLLPGSIIPELPATLEDAIAIAETKNPNIIAASHLTKAGEYQVSKLQGAILPEVSLDASASRSKGLGFVNNFDSDSLLLNMNIPLYQSGAEYARVREAKNRHQQSKFIELDVKNEVVETVTRAYEGYQTSLAVIDSTASAVEAADVAREGVRDENQFGVRTILDVLDAEQELFSSQVSLVRAERSKTIQAYQLLAAIGELSAGTLGLPVDSYDPKDHYQRVKWLPAGF